MEKSKGARPCPRHGISNISPEYSNNVAWRDSISRTETLLNACVKKGRKVAAFDNRSRKIPPLRVPLNTGSRIGSSATLSGPLNFLFETLLVFRPVDPVGRATGWRIDFTVKRRNFSFRFSKGNRPSCFPAKKESSLC